MKCFDLQDLNVIVEVSGVALKNMKLLPERLHKAWAYDMAVMALNGQRPDLGVAVVDKREEEKRLVQKLAQTDGDRHEVRRSPVPPTAETPKMFSDIYPVGTRLRLTDKAVMENGESYEGAVAEVTRYTIGGLTDCMWLRYESGHENATGVHTFDNEMGEYQHWFELAD